MSDEPDVEINVSKIVTEECFAALRPIMIEYVGEAIEEFRERHPALAREMEMAGWPRVSVELKMGRDQ